MKYAGEIARLAAPLAAIQMGSAALSLVDTAVVGRTTATELAGVGLGGSLLFAIAIVGMGVVLGTEPVIAQAVGSREPARARRAFRQGVWLALLMSPLVLIAIGLMAWLLPYTGVDPDIITPCRRYMLARAFSVPPFFLYWSCKAWLQAQGRTSAPVMGIIIALVLEVIFDLVLVPRYGGAGAGIANSVTTSVRLLVVVVACERVLRDVAIAGEAPPATWTHRWRRMTSALVTSELWGIVKIGLPLGLQMALEVAVFSFGALMMGRIGAQALASHQVAIQCASTTFNAMVGLGSATSVVVGRYIGARDKAGAFGAGMTSLVMSCGVMALTGALFLFCGASLARVLTDKPDVVAGAATLLAVAAAFQLSDGLQTVASGALRGAGDTRVAFLIHLLSHWAVGMPCVIWLGSTMGPAGVWWGLTLGLTVAAAALVTRFVLKSRSGYAPLASG